MLAYVTGTVDQELLARNEYLTAENRILKAQLNGRLKLSDAERSTLGEIGHRLGRTALAEVATVAKPDIILAWYRKLVAHKFDGSKARRGPGRPRVTRKVEQLIVRLAEENRDWGYDRIAAALANLGYRVCDQTVGNVLQRHGLPPAPERKRTTTWSAFIRAHLALLAGTDFFTAEVLALRGLMTYYVPFFIHLESRRVDTQSVSRGYGGGSEVLAEPGHTEGRVRQHIRRRGRRYARDQRRCRHGQRTGRIDLDGDFRRRDRGRCGAQSSAQFHRQYRQSRCIDRLCREY
jgi:putative transposase